MTHEQVAQWLQRYIEAWREAKPQLVEALFTEDAVYRFRPYPGERRSVEGIEEIVRSWTEDPDEPGSWEASYSPFAVDGDRAVVTGVSRYLGDGEPEKTYYNCFLLRFGPDGRCAEFTEFWMLVPAEKS